MHIKVYVVRKNTYEEFEESPTSEVVIATSDVDKAINILKEGKASEGSRIGMDIAARKMLAAWDANNPGPKYHGLSYPGLRSIELLAEYEKVVREYDIAVKDHDAARCAEKERIEAALYGDEGRGSDVFYTFETLDVEVK